MKTHCYQTAFAVLSFLVLLSPGAAMAGEDRPSHCTATEKTLFACTTGKKVLSICASKDFSEASGYVQYRFGPKGKPELSWPPVEDRSRKNIQIGQVRHARSISSHVRFKKGSYQYIVYDVFGAETESQAGVIVLKDGKKVATLLCRQEYMVNNLEDFIDKKYGLSWDEEEF